MLKCTDIYFRICAILPPPSGPKDNNLPQMFGRKIRMKSGMLNCTYILKIVPSLPQGSQTTIQLEHSPKFLAQNQDRIKNVEVYRHFRICAIPPPPSGPKNNNLTR